MAVDPQGARLPSLERRANDLFGRDAAGSPTLEMDERIALLRESIEPMLHREIHHTGTVHDRGGFHAELVGWVEVGEAL